MKKISIAFLCIIWGVVSSFAQQNIVDFEELSLPPESYWNGSDLSGMFTSKYLTFYNEYDEQWDFWGGFAYTNQTDNTTFSHENYSSAAGSGALGSSNYVIGYYSDFNNSTGIKIDTDISPETLNGMYLSLSAYVSLYMEFEDLYESEQHWLKLIITAYNTVEETQVSKEIIMADYRFNQSDGYKFEDWHFIDMTWTNDSDSLYFTMESSDLGEWGINTPTYFCIDYVNAELPSELPDFETEISFDKNIEQGENAEIYVFAKGGVQPYSYHWDNAESISDPNIQDPIANPEVTTVYTVTVTDAAGNEEVKSVTVNVGTTDIATHIAEKSSIFITDNKLEINRNDIILSVSVIDITGREIVRNSNVNSKHYSLNISGLNANNLYIIKIESSSGVETHKFLY